MHWFLIIGEFCLFRVGKVLDSTQREITTLLDWITSVNRFGLSNAVGVDLGLVPSGSVPKTRYLALAASI